PTEVEVVAHGTRRILITDGRAGTVRISDAIDRGLTTGGVARWGIHRSIAELEGSIREEHDLEVEIVLVRVARTVPLAHVRPLEDVASIGSQERVNSSGTPRVQVVPERGQVDPSRRRIGVRKARVGARRRGRGIEGKVAVRRDPYARMGRAEVGEG